MGAGGDELDAVAGRVLADLLARSHLLAPEEIGVVLAQAAEPLGVSGAWVYLADLQQRYLHAVPGAAGQRPHRQEIDGSTAGSAYQSASIRIARGRGTGPGRVWLPLLSGAERRGGLELQVSDVSEPMLTRYQMLASLAALLITSKSGYGDAYSQATRSQPMALQGEMVWAVTGPRTLATGEVLVTATLEPAYDVGGDAFDYSLLGDRLYVSVFDAVGHDVTSGLLTSMAMAACRSTRRSGGSLRDMVARADDAVARP